MLCTAEPSLGCSIPGMQVTFNFFRTLDPALSRPLQVNDRVNEAVCQQLEEGGVKYIALRCAGFDKVGRQLLVRKARKARACTWGQHPPDRLMHRLNLAMLFTSFWSTGGPGGVRPPRHPRHARACL